MKTHRDMVYPCHQPHYSWKPKIMPHPSSARPWSIQMILLDLNTMFLRQKLKELTEKWRRKSVGCYTRGTPVTHPSTCGTGCGFATGRDLPTRTCTCGTHGPKTAGLPTSVSFPSQTSSTQCRH